MMTWTSPATHRGSEYLLRSGAVEKNRGGKGGMDGVWMEFVEGFLVCFLAYLRDLPYSLSSSFELMVGFDECGPH